MSSKWNDTQMNYYPSDLTVQTIYKYVYFFQWNPETRRGPMIVEYQKLKVNDPTRFNRVVIEHFLIEYWKKFRVCLDFALLRSVIGWKISRHFFDQSEVKLKPKQIVTYSQAFSRAWRRLHVFATSSD